MRVRRDGFGELRRLRNLDWELLKYLSEKKGEPATREDLKQRWHEWTGGTGAANTVTAAIGTLNKQIKGLNLQAKGERYVGWRLIVCDPASAPSRDDSAAEGSRESENPTQ